MQHVRQLPVAPDLQLAAYAITPEHTDPTVALSGTTITPTQHRGELWQPPSPFPNFRPSVLVHPRIYLAPPPRIGDQTGDQTELPTPGADAKTGMPASTWELRRNYRPVPFIEAGEAEV